jgi:Tfp pilus assembly protein PilZ
MDPRAEPRFKKRMPCKLRRNQIMFHGLVLDVSRTGLFVQSSAAAKVGDEIEVALSRRERETTIELIAEVVWQRKAPQQLRSVVEGGLGLKICYAPEPYYTLLAEAAHRSAPA